MGHSQTGGQSHGQKQRKEQAKNTQLHVYQRTPGETLWVFKLYVFGRAKARLPSARFATSKRMETLPCHQPSLRTKVAPDVTNARWPLRRSRRQVATPRFSHQLAIPRVANLAAIIEASGEFRKPSAARAARRRCAIGGQRQKRRKSLLSKGTLGRLTSYYVGEWTCARVTVSQSRIDEELEEARSHCRGRGRIAGHCWLYRRAEPQGRGDGADRQGRSRRLDVGGDRVG